MHFIRRLFDSNSGQPKRNIRKRTFKMESLEGREVPAVLFYGGNVLPAVETQAVYLGNGWNSQADKKPMDAFLTDITNSSYMDALKTAGYGVGRGTSSAGVTDNTVIMQQYRIAGFNPNFRAIFRLVLSKRRMRIDFMSSTFSLTLQ